MTRKVYRSAMGKTVDLGALLLQNEQVRAVGNMGVNAAGDIIDGSNQIIKPRNQRIQRQYRNQTNVSNIPVATSNLAARQSVKNTPNVEEVAEPITETQSAVDLDPDLKLDSSPEPVSSESGGLAAAIARSREIKQELEKSLKQRQQEQGIRKI